MAVVGLFLAFDIGFIGEALKVQPLGLDFAPTWSGARMALERPGDLYDFEAVTRDQAWFLGSITKLRPFVYPPSALPLFLPFGLMGFWPAYVGFMLLTGALLAWATWRISHSGLAVALLLVVPSVVLSVVTGQVSLLIGGLALTAFSLRRREILAGVLLGIAAAVKPQLLVLFPLALALEARWRALAAAIGAGGAMCAISAAVLGVSPWFEWIAALPRFSALINGADYLPMTITPTGALVRLGLGGPPLLAAQTAFSAAGVGVVWWAFTRATTPAQRLTALIGGSLLIAPYALKYELAAIAPAAAILGARLDDPRWVYALLALMMLTLLAPGLIALLGVMIFILQPWWPAAPETPPPKEVLQKPS
jgi:hypothetical protein